MEKIAKVLQIDREVLNIIPKSYATCYANGCKFNKLEKIHQKMLHRVCMTFKIFVILFSPKTMFFLILNIFQTSKRVGK